MYTGKNGPKIKSLDELIEELRRLPVSDDLLSRIDPEPDTYLPKCRWQTDSYARIPVIRTPIYEIVLVCWEPGQGAEAHNHDKSACWVKVLQGELTETIYAGGGIVATSGIRRAGEYTYIDDTVGIHSMMNRTPHRTISLHLYTPPINRFNYYDIATGEVVRTVVPER